MSELHDRFRTLDRVTAPDLWAEIANRAASQAPARALPWGASRTLRLALVLVALLVVASIGIALVGALFRGDRLDPDAFRLNGPVFLCNPRLDDDLAVSVQDASLAAPDQMPDVTDLWGYSDGRVVIGPSAETGGTANSLEATWSQRRLTAAGLQSLIGSLTGSLPSCRAYPRDGGWITITARTDAGLQSIVLGEVSFETRATTESEQAVVSDLVELVRDPDLGLAAGEWEEPAWTEYLPERWRFSLQFSDQFEPANPSAEGIVLPDGSTLHTFGSEEPIESLDPAAAWPELSMQRCAITGASEARTIARILDEAGGRPEPEIPGWSFNDGQNIPNGVIWITVAGLLPHEPDCPSEVPPLPLRTPGPLPSTPTDPGVPFADACAYLPEPIIVGAQLDGPVEHHPDWSSDWAMCWYPVANSGLPVFSSRRPVPAGRATDQVESLFGPDTFTTEEIGGHPVFFNDCAVEGDPCRAAVAISADPHFVVAVWDAGSADVLRMLAERVVQELRTDD